MKPLEIYMDEAARRPFDPGAHDCCLFLADWVLNVRGVDPAAHLRGRYSSVWGYRRLLLLHGGMVGIVGSCAKRAQLAETSEPRRGDIGVTYAMVEGQRAPGLVGAICCGKRWVALAPTGMIGAQAKPAIAWRV